MFRELAPDVLEALDLSGTVLFQPITKGDVPKAWSGPIKYHILFRIGELSEHLFDCYLNEYDETVQITNLEPSNWMKEQSKGILDGYMYIMLKNAKRFVKLMECKRLIVSSYLPMLPEHLVDLGFNVRARTNGGQVQGFVNLEKET